MTSPSFTIPDLRCEYLVNPLGIDEVRPRLSWRLESDRRGAAQTAYRVLVSASAGGLAKGQGDLWDSGRVLSSVSTHVVYGGRPLGSRQFCHWMVEVWDETGASHRSAPAFWSMGLLAKEDWSASWIAGNPEAIARDLQAITPTVTEPGSAYCFWKAFNVEGPLRRASLYVSARGLVDVHIDARRIGEDFFVPEWTDYNKRIHYRTYDVTGLLHAGRNTLGVALGDGWYSGYVGWQETRGRYGLENSFILQLELEAEDGRIMRVVSDDSWRCNTGPILSSDFMMGELYDARREHRGCSGADFDASSWLSVKRVDAAPVPLVAQRSEPVRITQTLEPVSIRQAACGAFIYDFGQNISGWLRLKVEGRAGAKFTLRHAERLNPDGSLYTENLRRAKATDVYICRGQGTEEWQPHFTFHGFQYAEVSGFEGQPPKDAVTACVVHSAIAPVGHFECSHPGVNRLWLNGCWSQRDNFLSVPTDCPQRDERLGWMGDAQVFLRTATCNMDVAAFFTKWMIDVEDAQTPEGIFPDTAPRLREDSNFVGLDQLGGGAGWADAGIIIPYTIWRVYGDTRIVERHWKAMVAWLEYLERTNPDGHRVRELANNYGDWLCIPSDREFRTHSPMKNLLATAYWADDANKLALLAGVLGRDGEARRFKAMFEKVRDAFQKNYLLEDGRLSVETQTAYLLALSMDLLPEAVRARAAEHLVANIRDLGWHLSTGFIGISHLNPTLTLTGHSSVAYRLLLQETYPSWLYPVLHGATTIWERWNGWTEKDGFFNPAMNSFNHYSLGSVGEWLFRHVGGIELDSETPGFKRFVLKPFFGEGLDYATVSYRSIHGEIVSAWKRKGGQLDWTVRVPANTVARIHLPCPKEAAPVESGKPVDQVQSLSCIQRTSAVLIADLVPGTYHFSTLLP